MLVSAVRRSSNLCLHHASGLRLKLEQQGLRFYGFLGAVVFLFGILFATQRIHQTVSVSSMPHAVLGKT